MDLMIDPGTVLEEKYLVRQVIGGGGMAFVYRVEDTRLGSSGQVWALKELRSTSGSADDQAEAQRLFRQEAELLANLDHPNLPEVVEHFDVSGRSYLVMEFIEGQSLERHLMAAGTGLPETSVLQWTIQVCQVLDYLHQQEPAIIFRDLKPSNIMLSNAGVIKLIDFGIARTYKAGKKKDTVAMGSENYAPPEQWGKGQTDARSDIYALGATIYHLIAGEPPLPWFSPKPLPPPTSFNSAISAGTDGVILKAMSKAPPDRYQTAAEMEAALVDCLKVLSMAEVDVPEPPIVVDEPCPACERSNRPQARFCAHCGTPLTGQLRGVLQVMGPAGLAWEKPLDKSPFLIGRSNPNGSLHPDLDLSYYDAQYISRRHAQVTQKGNQYLLTDLESANGTFVNGTRLSPRAPQPLRTGDRIQIGKARLVFQLFV